MKDRKNACLLRLFGEGTAGGDNVGMNAATRDGNAAEGDARSGDERRGDLSGSEASGSDEAFDALIRGEYREAFERRVRSILAEREAGKGSAALPGAGSVGGTSAGGDGSADGTTAGRADGSPVNADAKTALRRREAGGGDVPSEVDVPSEGDIPSEVGVSSASGDPSEPREDPSERLAEERRRSAGRRAVLAGWVREAEALRRIAPGFDFASEMRDPRFRTLVENNVPLEDAFFALRRDAVLPAAMHAAARHAEAAVAAAYLSGQDRPREAAAGASSVPAPRSDVAGTSRADRDEICRRAARGDRIVF